MFVGISWVLENKMKQYLVVENIKKLVIISRLVIWYRCVQIFLAINEAET
mgnify:CR=1 FL=1